LVLGIELENLTLLPYIQAVRASPGKDFHVLDVEEMEATTGQFSISTFAFHSGCQIFIALVL
jgi:hypothetical protein